MNNYEYTQYALQDNDGNLIGIDQTSGGYPWVPDNTIVGVHFDCNIERLKRYAETFSHGYGGPFKLVKITVTVEPA